MSELAIILSRIEDIGRKVDANTAATNEVVTANAVLTERVQNLITKTDEHIDSDKETHEKQGKDISSLKDWRTSIMAKVASYAAVAAFAWGVVFALGKEALASVFHLGGHGP